MTEPPATDTAATDVPRVVAVMVAYGSDASITENIEAVLGQVEAAIVVDNGSPADTVDRLESLALRHTSLTLLRNARNEGLGPAQNRGIALALSRGADWILLLDDDSLCAPDMVATLLAAGERFTDQERVGLLAAVPRFQGRERPARFLLAGFPPRTREVEAPTLGPLYFAIASGSLVRAGALRAVGPMRAAFFVDYMDVDFGLRLNRAGLTIHAVRDARFRHRLGEPLQRRVGPVTVASTNHSASRRYLMYRNRARLWREYALVFPAWAMFDFAAALVHLLRILAAESGRRAKLGAAVSGIVRGLFGARDELTGEKGFDG